jgi:hypothetical protein
LLLPQSYTAKYKLPHGITAAAAAAPSADAETAGKQRHLYYCMIIGTIITVTQGNFQAHTLTLQTFVQPTLTKWIAARKTSIHIKHNTQNG